MHAVRNIKLCTKDCLCLYVCPTGATDTEDGQIDNEKCLSGCRACVDACPSHAISLIPDEYPEPKEKSDEVKKALFNLADSKSVQEGIASAIAATNVDPIVRQLANAIKMSNRLLAEDLLRESGYLLPQGESTMIFLERLLETTEDKDFPYDKTKRLIEILRREEP